MGGPNWCMGSPSRRDEEGEVVAALFDADALGGDGDESVGCLAAGTAAAADAVLGVGDADAFLGALREVDHAERRAARPWLLWSRRRGTGG